MDPSSRELFGRDRELSEADEALDVAASGTPQVLLVGGDAGIGKTTLVNAVLDRARERGFTALVGHCLDIDDGVALRPVREALRQAVVGRSLDELPPLTRRLSPYLTGETDVATVDELGLAVGELAAEGPVLVVLEDLHWADRSTIDFAATVARTARGPVCLLLTVRSDEIGRSHPFRQAMVDLGRSPGTHRLDLTALGRDGVAALAARRTSGSDAAFVNSVFERSEGNPLYAEELLSAGPDSLPEALSDLLLRRVDGLSEQARAVLRMASAHGTRLSPRLLGEALGLDEAAVDPSLREALDAHVLKTVGGHLDFRHGLIREAVHDDLMPGERAQAHARLAAGLERLSGDDLGMTVLSQLSFHWYAAHDLARAYRTAVRAGLLGWRLDRSDCVVHFDRALELYESVPHPGGSDDPAKAELLAMRARLCDELHELDRARQLIGTALDLVDESADPLSAARVYTWYARCSFELPGRFSHAEALERAIRLFGEDRSEGLVLALMTQGVVAMRRERIAEGDRALALATEVAAAIDAPLLEAKAWHQRAWCAVWQGRLSDGLACYDEAVRADRRAGAEERVGLDLLGRSVVLMQGLDPVRGLADAEEQRVRALASGDLATSAWAGWAVAHGLVNAGLLDDAEEVLATALAETAMAEDDLDALYPRVRLLLMRGQAAAALPLELERMREIDGFASTPNADWVLLHVQVLLANGLADEALRKVRNWLPLFAESDGAPIRGTMAHAAYLAVEAARRAGSPETEDVTKEAGRLLALMEGDLDFPSQCSYLGYSVPAATALRAELHGEPSADLWRAAYDAAAHVGAGLALPIRLRLLGALLAEGERDEVRTALPELVAEAKAMGATGLAEDSLKLGRRHRIPVPGDDRPSRLDILTPREREVLDVLATGATNKAIGERLFISEKTVAVHVSNVMAKLGVTNRTEAAAVARELAPSD